MLHSILFTTVLKPCYLTWFHSLCYSFYFLTCHLKKFIFIQVHIYLHTQLKYKDEQNSWRPYMYGSSILIGKTECNKGNKCIIQCPQMTNMKNVGEKVETVMVYPGFLFFIIFYFLFILLYNTVLVLPYTDMNQPWVYMSSQSWTHFPPLWIISLDHPRAPAPSTCVWTFDLLGKDQNQG